MKTPNKSVARAARSYLAPLLCGAALLLLAASAHAQIALVDNELTPASTFNAKPIALTTNLAVTPSANTLVVVVTFQNALAPNLEAAPANAKVRTNAITTNTLTLAVQKASKATGGRGCAIYYCYNPTPGSGYNILGKLSGTASSGALVAYTLSGVDTTIATPPSGSASASPGASLSFAVNITPNSWAAVGGAEAANPGVASITATSSGSLTGTPVLTADTAGFSSASTALLGYISSILFGGSDTFSMSNAVSQDCALCAVAFSPSTLTFLGIDQQPQSVTIPSGQGLNATFTVSANGNPAITSYQWYEISGGTTNLITGANTTSYTVNSPTVNDKFFVMVGNGSATVTSSVAALNLYTDGTWNTSSGSWNTPGNWVGNAIATGVNATASFINGLGGTVTLDNAAGFTVGTERVWWSLVHPSVQPAWTINSGSPAGTY